MISDSYSVRFPMEPSSSEGTRKYVPAYVDHQPSTRPSLKPVSRGVASPPTDVEKNCRPSLGYKRMAQEDDCMVATTNWKVFLWKEKRGTNEQKFLVYLVYRATSLIFCPGWFFTCKATADFCHLNRKNYKQNPQNFIVI